nr:MAG TPA_asm: hypothetical protein [Caudoviricetes sp.]
MSASGTERTYAQANVCYEREADIIPNNKSCRLKHSPCNLKSN